MEADEEIAKSKSNKGALVGLIIFILIASAIAFYVIKIGKKDNTHIVEPTVIQKNSINKPKQ